MEVHFELQRTLENELHSVELMMGIHFGKKGYNLSYNNTVLTSVPKSLHLEHHTAVIDDDGNVQAELPEHGIYTLSKLNFLNTVSILCPS